MNDSLKGPRAWALAAVQIVVALLFLFAGGSKLFGQPEMVATFEKIGFGQWFRYLTGLLEVVGAIALVIPSTAALGAALLVFVMFGAVGTHLFLIGGSPVAALALLLLTGAILWFRRGDLEQRFRVNTLIRKDKHA